MSTPHINAPEGAFAKTVLMPGDPLRAKFVAENFLEDAKLVTSVRNVYGFTGTYNGKPVTVMASGMGMPSMGIYSYELFHFYDVDNIIRIGSAGSYTEELDVHDLILADSAYGDSRFARVQNGAAERINYPSPELNKVIIETAQRLGIDLKTGRIHSSDVFYGGPNGVKWTDVREKHGALCVEMESFALFHNANFLGKRAACLLTISDSLVTHTSLSAEDRQESFRTMMKLALESAIAI